MRTTIKTLLAGAVLATCVAGAVPASAQGVYLGPGGPGLDLRARGGRERDVRRGFERRDRGYYREERFREDRRERRRGYGY